MGNISKDKILENSLSVFEPKQSTSVYFIFCCQSYEYVLPTVSKFAFAVLLSSLMKEENLMWQVVKHVDQK